MALESAADSEAVPKKWSFAWVTGVSFCGILAVLFAVSYVTFGSIGAATAFLRGERLLFDTKSKSFGTVDQKKVLDVAFKLRNLSGRPVQLIGAHVNCSCMRAEGLPCSLGPGSSQLLRFTISTRSLSGAVTKPIKLYTDYRPQRVIALEVCGQVIGNQLDPSSAAGSPEENEK